LFIITEKLENSSYYNFILANDKGKPHPPNGDGHVSINSDALKIATRAIADGKPSDRLYLMVQHGSFANNFNFMRFSGKYNEDAKKMATHQAQKQSIALAESLKSGKGSWASSRQPVSSFVSRVSPVGPPLSLTPINYTEFLGKHYYYYY
jgi:hypothetical protein